LAIDLTWHLVNGSATPAYFADLARYGAGSRPNRVSPISQSTTCLSAS